MITCHLMGGLGNQLFQIFTTVSYAITHNQRFGFLNVGTLGGNGCTKRHTYWNTFLCRLQPFLLMKYPDNISIIREKTFYYNELLIDKNINKDILLYGYFQSYKYFENSYNSICKMICLEKMKTELLYKLKINSDYLINSISMHFRLGDYKNIQQYHPLLEYEYYLNSLDYIKSKSPDIKYNIYYFCEEDDITDVINKINKLEKIYPEYTFKHCDNTLNDWEQLLLMSCCNHNIIANSTFSWWGAYLNNCMDKIVCYPSVWFGLSSTHDIKDLCPENWIKI